MNCPRCQTDNDGSATACFGCGAPLVTPTNIQRGMVVAGRYEIQATLGKGGMGMVFRAFDRVLEETVALKVLRSEVAMDPDIARRFRQEIKLARKVRHRNVCGIHEYGEADGLRFIAMEYIEGVDLRAVLRKQGAPLPAEAFEIALQVCEGLHAIHEAGIIHRDLKTPNIMRDARGYVRLMDFGIAKQAGDATLSGTAMGMIVGTPEYMSPEQARGEKVDFRSDVYALGIVIFEVFTGDVPFRGDTPIATIFKHMQDPPPLVGPLGPVVPASLVPVLNKALAKKAEDRHDSVQHLVEELRDAQHQFHAHTGAPVPPHRARTDRFTVPTLRPGAAAQPLAEPARTPLPTPVPTGVPTLVPTEILRSREAQAAEERAREEAARRDEQARQAAFEVRRALGTGDLEGAARALAEAARAHGAHPAFAGLEAAVAQAREHERAERAARQAAEESARRLAAEAGAAEALLAAGDWRAAADSLSRLERTYGAAGVLATLRARVEQAKRETEMRVLGHLDALLGQRRLEEAESALRDAAGWAGEAELATRRRELDELRRLRAAEAVVRDAVARGAWDDAERELVRAEKAHGTNALREVRQDVTRRRDAARQAEAEAARRAEEARRAEAARQAEEKRRADEARAQAAREAEAARQAEEARKAEA
ncbi:MAG TPA: serine/threonine-protein kinase, partial [Vicinamibacteria bacterium]